MIFGEFPVGFPVLALILLESIVVGGPSGELGLIRPYPRQIRGLMIFGEFPIGFPVLALIFFESIVVGGPSGELGLIRPYPRQIRGFMVFGESLVGFPVLALILLERIVVDGLDPVSTRGTLLGRLRRLETTSDPDDTEAAEDRNMVSAWQNL